MDLKNYSNLADKITIAFTDTSKYTTFKHIDECSESGVLIGDVYITGLFEARKGNVPRLITAISPYSVKTSSSTNQMLIYEGAELVANIPWTEAVPIRTGVMDAVIVKILELSLTPADKVLYIGSGKVATASAKALVEIFGTELQIEYSRASDVQNNAFEALSKSIKFVKSKDIELENYNFIFCHTNSKELVITKENLGNLSNLKLLTYYIDSSIGFEVDPIWLDDFIRTHSEANIIVDVPDTLKLKKEFALIKHNPEKIMDLSRIINTKPTLKGPIVFRAGGSAIQDLALYDALEN